MSEFDLFAWLNIFFKVKENGRFQTIFWGGVSLHNNSQSRSELKLLQRGSLA